MTSKKLKHEIVCPYCDKTMGKQGIYGHIRGNHKGMEDDYRARFPPKMTSIKPKKNEPKHEIKEPEPKPKPDPIEEIMTEEIKEPEIKVEVKEPVKEVVKPVAPVVPVGDVKSVKGKSFLDWLFGEDEDKSGVSKSNKDEDDDWL